MRLADVTTRARSVAVCLLLSPAVGVALAGCQSFDSLATPDVHLRVVDAGTLQPIEGAKVTVTSNVDPEVRSVAQTDRMGIVHLPALDRTIWVAPLPVSLPYPTARITVEAAGYQPLAFISTEAGGAYIAGAKPAALMPAASP